jgi:uncharacterized membrane protein
MLTSLLKIVEFLVKKCENSGYFSKNRLIYNYTELVEFLTNKQYTKQLRLPSMFASTLDVEGVFY